MNILEFITQNQNLIIVVALICSYFLKQLIDHQAAKPQDDIWDKVKPASDVLYQIVFKGVELLAQSKKVPAAEKLLAYQQQIKQFEANWKVSPVKAVEELAAWYLSMEQKAGTITANPTLTADTEARE